MTDKSPEAFRTISEVAEELDLPQHVLRFWETKFSQIRPMKRSSGRRFYRGDDVVLLRAIRDMLYGQGYTIRGVQKLLKERGARAVMSEIPAAPAAVQEEASEPAPQMYPAPRYVSAETSLPAGTIDTLRVLHGEVLACANVLQNARRR